MRVMVMKQRDKRWIAAALTLVLCAFFSACAPRSAEIEPEAEITGDLEQMRPKEELVTIVYPASEVQALADSVIENAKNDQYTNFLKLSAHYELECLRKVEGGYYTVLHRDDGKWTFFFMDQSKRLNWAFTCKDFPSAHDYAEYAGTHRLNGRVPDPYRVDYGYGVVVTGHWVQEGELVIRYDLESWGDVVDAAYFHGHSLGELLFFPDDGAGDWVIYPIDKQNTGRIVPPELVSKRDHSFFVNIF